MVESFWGRMQVELFNRRRWKTRIELATAIHDYIEHFHNTRRRHSALGWLTPPKPKPGSCSPRDERRPAKTATNRLVRRTAPGWSPRQSIDSHHQHQEHQQQRHQRRSTPEHRLHRNRADQSVHETGGRPTRRWSIAGELATAVGREDREGVRAPRRRARLPRLGRSPDLLGGLDHEPQLRDLLLTGERVAVDR